MLPSASIPVMKPQPVRSEFLLPRLESVARSGVFSNRGPQVKELEGRIAEWVPASPTFVVATSNASVGLTAAVALSPAERSKVRAWSFPATALAPLQAGKLIEFEGLDPRTWLPNTQPDSPKVGLITVIPFGGSFDSGVWAADGEHIVDAAASLATQPDPSSLS